MKKILCALISVVIITLPSHANVLGRVFQVSTIIDLSLLASGEYITITGFAGGDIHDGRLKFHESGAMGSEPMYIEVRKYNPSSGNIGPLLTDLDATQIAWNLFTEPELKINNSIISGNKVDMYINGKQISGSDIYVGKPSEYSRVAWQVKSNNSLGNIFEAGDNVEVKGIVMVSVLF